VLPLRNQEGVYVTPPPLRPGSTPQGAGFLPRRSVRV
jgi:hypothetical protein